MKLKIGDRVRIKCPASEYHNRDGIVSSTALLHEVMVRLENEEVLCLFDTLELVPEDTPYFDGVQVGDKVYSVAYGEGVIAKVSTREKSYLSYICGI